MKVIVCGAGRVGSTIARYLAEDGNDVVLIDTDEGLLTELTSTMEVRPVVGFASYPSVLEQANAQDADMLIAVTASDEVNMVTCQAANSLFKVPMKIARLRSNEYTNPKWRKFYTHDALPIDYVISPEVEIARSIRRNISLPGAFEVIPLAMDKVHLLGIHCDDICPMINTPLRQLTELFPDVNAVVAALVRDSKLIIADSNTRICAGDDVYVFVPSESVHRILTLFGRDQERAQNVLILGGNNVGLYLAQYLEKASHHMHVTLIEENAKRAEFLAETLSETTVIHGDFLSTGLLEEADIDIVETVIAVSSKDENNILASLMAKRYGVEQTVSVIEKPLYSQLVVNLGIDVIVDPKDIMVSSILQHVRRGKIYAAYSIRSGLCEVLEADVFETFEYAGKTLRDVRLPAGVIIGAIVRDGTPLALRGDTVIEKDDRLVLFADAESVKQVEKMFSVGLEFF
ncbi:MAG: Trk system potassium transporter TrkA [Alphaproteobacteria bacterium]|nr:Trk system potassium transporter TrkA [Alphaproteobacteria bacterium]